MVREIVKYLYLGVSTFALAIVLLFLLCWCFKNPLIESTNEQFGGNVTQIISVVYDRDTGVYYALTDNGLSPLYNADGSLKLVDGGDPS